MKLTLTILALGFRYYKEILFVDCYILHYLVYYGSDMDHEKSNLNALRYDRMRVHIGPVSDCDRSNGLVPFDDIFDYP